MAWIRRNREIMNKTIFVLLDACQYEAGTRNLGYLEHLTDCGLGAKYKVKGDLPSLSAPMYATLLTGVPAHVHGIVANETLHTLSEENVFSLCRRHGGVTGAAAYYWISELYNHSPFLMMEDRIQTETGGMIDAGIFYWEDEYPDTHLFADGEYIRRTYNPDFMMYHSMAIDYAGHAKGAGSREYEEAVAKAGHILAALMGAWRREGYQVVVTADHGINTLGIHGGTDEWQRDVPLYIFADGIRTGRFEEQYISQLNIAPLLCRLLGIPAGASMKSRLETWFLTD